MKLARASCHHIITKKEKGSREKGKSKKRETFSCSLTVLRLFRRCGSVEVPWNQNELSNEMPRITDIDDSH